MPCGMLLAISMRPPMGGESARAKAAMAAAAALCTFHIPGGPTIFL
jgi:hypothetical protein